MNKQSDSPRFWGITLLAASMLMMTMGVRQTSGLFVAPIVASTAIGLANLSLALAVAQFVWGAVQPLAGMAADRYGHARVLVAGVMLLALGTALAPLMTSAWGMVLTLGIVAATGSGMASFSVLIGAAAQRLPAERRGMASGIINAGGSFGQFVFAPLAQSFIVLFGWMGAMWSFAAITLAAIPIGRALRAEPVSSQAAAAIHAREPGLKAALQDALANRSYLLLHAGFYTCGFHIAFLVTHLPGEVRLCGLQAQVASWSIAIIGLANIAGSLLAGWGVQHFRSKYLLSGIYASRAMMIAIYLPAPKTPITFYVFAAGLGLTWLSTVPPTVSVVGKLFGTRHLATLFGLTLLSHQIGGFFGAWVGGIVVVRSGTYDSMWYADIALAASAALLNLPIREPRMAAALEPA